MVNKSEDNEDVDVEITNEETGFEDVELEEIEEKGADKMKKLREKLKACEADKMQAMEDLQRTKAEFLNARKRLEDEKIQDRLRSKTQHAQELLPLCDSFQMAMSDKAVWEKADKSWRAGIEGINMQLMQLLQSYGVKEIKPEGETFNPTRHEAIGTQKVDSKEKQDIVLSVVQNGYEMKIGDSTEVIRPARVTTGIFE